MLPFTNCILRERKKRDWWGIKLPAIKFHSPCPADNSRLPKGCRRVEAIQRLRHFHLLNRKHWGVSSHPCWNFRFWLCYLSVPCTASSSLSEGHFGFMSCPCLKELEIFFRKDIKHRNPENTDCFSIFQHTNNLMQKSNERIWELWQENPLSEFWISLVIF